MFVSLFVAIRISAIKEKRTELFPYGQFVYEALYSLLKGIMISGVLLVSFIQNTTAIFHYLGGQETGTVNTTVILVYSIAMVTLCFGSALFYRRQNKKSMNSSTLLRAEYSAAIVDGVMSAGIGVALVSIRFVDREGAFGFLHYIGDSLLVILLCLILGRGPLLLIRDSFIELAGGTLQDKKSKTQIKNVLEKHISRDSLLATSYITKTGSNYLVVAYLNTDLISMLQAEEIHGLRQNIDTELKELFPSILFEIVLR